MAKSLARPALWAGCLLLAGSAPAWAQQPPSVEQMLDGRFAPKQKDISITTPAAAELKACTVRGIPGNRPGSTGWELIDARKQPVRRYFGGKGAKGGVDTWCYFKDGVEVYREIDTNNDGVPDQFRWFNAGGMRWGIDNNNDGKIDAWRIISAEEVGYEAFQAVTTGDFARLQALFITPAEMQALKLPAKEVDRLTAAQKQAAKKFADLVKAQPHLATARFERVEGTPPSCVPGEQVGAESDLIKFASRAVLYSVTGADKQVKHDWLHTGELIQVGFAWRLTDVPGTEDVTPTTPEVVSKADPKLKEALEKLEKLDNQGQALPPGDAKAKEYLEARIALVQQVIPLVEAKEHEGWYKQIFDNLSTLAQAGDAPALKNLTALRDQVVNKLPGSNLAAYGVYREMWVHYILTVNPPGKAPQPNDVEKTQKAWLEQLAKFVQTYPKAEDTTPDALHQLAMHTEFVGNKDDEAKRWYEQVYTNFPDHYLAEKCKGAVRRLDLVGKKLELTGPQLQSGAPFDVASVKDKLVVVYFWTSTITQCVGDFARLNKLMDTHPGKLELVSVNLDDTPDLAVTFLKGTPAKGVHLYQPAPKGAGGMSSPLALQFGINGLPTAFLVGRDGRVVSRSLQVGDLENELKK
jgi:thiol-disulfide isomerase/thioredoxin